MPTARGWVVASTGAGLVAAAAIFGSTSLLQVGVALIALVPVAVAVVRRGNHDVAIERTISPQRGRPEQAVSVTLRVVNRGRDPAALILLHDSLPLELSGRARFVLHGLEQNGDRAAVYGLRPVRRGVYRIGPLEIAFRDPFGLASLEAEATPATDFLVHPRIEKLTLPPDGGDRRSTSLSALRQLTGARGEDFYTLREYVEGDDLRKIHWPSTARLERTMIRQEETPWQTRATIVLDDRPHPGDRSGGAAFERCVEAAASFVDLYHRSGYGYRLVTANRGGLASARGAGHYSRCMDLLATLQPGGAGEADPLLLRLAEIEGVTSPEGTLVVVSAGIDAKAAILLSRCSRRFRDTTAVLFPLHRFGAEPTRARWEGERAVVGVTGLLNQAGIRVLVLGPGQALAGGWAPHSKGGVTWARRAGLV